MAFNLMSHVVMSCAFKKLLGARSELNNLHVSDAFPDYM